jgi:alkanesulfonate monooxygenase SsuD/methylene tetrahydromethanopterin reductase-like flavin-dependent oxidoreductase (luciferase family)
MAGIDHSQYATQARGKSAMHYGLFTELQCPEGRPEVQLYDELLEQTAAAEALGFEAMWMAELHFHRRFSILSAPLLAAAAAAQRTQCLRLGIAVNLLPLHQPVRLAEEGAVLDVLSHGRLDFGVGRGHPFPGVYDNFHVSPAQSRERFAEALDILIGAWTHEPFSYQGEYFQVSDLTVVPKPVQQPHPPIFVAAGSPETYTATGQRGLGILVPGHVQPMEALRANLSHYWEAGAAAGHAERLRLTFLMPVYVAERQQQAEADPEPHVMYYYSVLGGLLSGEFPESYQRYGESRRRLGTLSYDAIRRERAIFGEPAYCLERLQHLRETLGVHRLMAWMNIGGMPHAKVLGSMRLFAERVMPALG